MEYTHVTHTFGPVFDQESRVLILGSFPSVKSREQQFYYGHPKNRFWAMLAAVYGEAKPETIEEKKDFLLCHKLALWDVIHSCDIQGSSDVSICNVQVNNLEIILQETQIGQILCNGGKAYELLCKYCSRPDMPPVFKMPSTSPANAAWRLERLVDVWKDKLYF